MDKRNLFEELKQSLEEVVQHNQGKITLKTTQIDALPPLQIDSQTILNTNV